MYVHLPPSFPGKRKNGSRKNAKIASQENVALVNHTTLTCTSGILGFCSTIHVAVKIMLENPNLGIQFRC